jgi:hypothetical protein
MFHESFKLKKVLKCIISCLCNCFICSLAFIGVLSSGEALLYPQIALSSAGFAVLNLHDNGQISYNVSKKIQKLQSCDNSWLHVLFFFKSVIISLVLYVSSYEQKHLNETWQCKRYVSSRVALHSMLYLLLDCDYVWYIVNFPILYPLQIDLKGMTSPVRYLTIESLPTKTGRRTIIYNLSAQFRRNSSSYDGEVSKNDGSQFFLNKYIECS